MAKTLLEVRFISDDGECIEHMDKEKLGVITKHQPVINIDGNLYEIEQFEYNVNLGVFFILLRKP